MKRTDIINKLIKDNGYKSYLEIGVPDPRRNYYKIDCERKECVDPLIDDPLEQYDLIDTSKWLTYRMTSDEMFESMPEDKKFDIIFIDGLHHEDQVDRDLFNSFKHLNENGCIVVHDCLPQEEVHQLEKRETGIWNGTVWKSIPKLGQYGIRYVVVDADFGVGIVKYGVMNKLPEKSKLFWGYFEVFREELMHVVSKNYFLNNPGENLWKNYYEADRI